MKIAIVGSREYPNMQKVVDYINNLPLDTVIVSGGARGVDRTAETTAKGRGMKTQIFTPNWEKHGRKAGIMRNTDIVEAADKVVAFWDGVSNGTRDSIRKAQQMGKELEIIKP